MCGAEMHHVTTDLPFKINERSIVNLKELPVLQCANFSEYLVEDAIMERVDAILSNVDVKAELEIIRFAA